jgi:flagellin
MGLRINNNIAALNASRQLRASNTKLGQSLERLSTGLKINNGKDDPAGLIISEQLRSQIAGLKQAVTNAQDAINLVGTAEGALSEVSNLLLSIRRLALDSANAGATDQDQNDANQAEVDSAITSINRIANTTQYGGKKLLNGTAGFQLADISQGIKDVQVDRAVFGSAETLEVKYKILQPAKFAEITLDLGATGKLATSSIVQFTGPKGGQQIAFGAESTAEEIIATVQSLKENTGITARKGATDSEIIFVSTDVGTDQRITLEDIDGDKTLFANGGNSVTVATGTDIEGTVNGVLANGYRNELSVAGPQFSGKLVFNYNAIVDSAIPADATSDQAAEVVQSGILNASDANGSFNIATKGLVFQLGAFTDPIFQDTVGIDDINAQNLGVAAGRLSSIVAGGVNNLSANPERAAKIIDASVNDIAKLRARLGAIQKNTFETTINSLEIAIENLTASESRIRDLDFAEETVLFTRNQILVQAGTSIAAQANASTQSVLKLLQ